MSRTVMGGLLVLSLAGCTLGDPPGPASVTGLWSGTQKLSSGVVVQATYDLTDLGGHIQGKTYPTDIPGAAQYAVTGTRSGGTATLEFKAGSEGYTWKISGTFTAKTFTGSAQILDGPQAVGSATVQLSRQLP